MSSPVRAFSAGPSAATRSSSSKKRVLSDSEDTGPGEVDREVKRSKSVPSADAEGSQARHKEKDKKRRKKKRRKVSVVLTAGLEEATTSAQERPRSQSARPTLSAVAPVLAALTSEVPTVKMEPAAEPVVMVQPEVVTPSSESNTKQEEIQQDVISSDVELSEKSKGKQRATSVLGAPDNSDTRPASVGPSNDDVKQLSAELLIKSEVVDKHATLLASFSQSLACQICLALMHKPYALAPCGHIACYSCLVSWFKGPLGENTQDALPTWIRKKTCPHCRTVVRERPAELWVVKDMVASLVKSGLVASSFPAAPATPEEGMPAGDPWAGIFRSTGGAGIFPAGPAAPLHQQMMGLHDAEDGGVYRCVECHHEILDGRCSNCHRPYPGHGALADDDDYDPDDLDGDELAHMWFGGFGGLYADEDDDFSDDVGVLPWHMGGGGAHIEDNEDEDDESGSSEYEGSFIDDDELDAWRQPLRVQRLRQVVNTDDNTDVEEQPGPSSGTAARRSRSAMRQSVPLRPPRRAITNAPIVISDSDDGEAESRVSSLDEDDLNLLDGGDTDVSAEEVSNEGDGPRDLASEVAALERDIYGDDGSVPRGRHRGVWLSDEEDGESADEHL